MEALKYGTEDLIRISEMFVSLTDNYNNCNSEGLSENLQELLNSEYPIEVLEQYVLSINSLSSNRQITEDDIMGAACYILMRMNFCS